MNKLNGKGFAHWIIPALVVAVIGGIGTYLVVGSHAATCGPNSTVNACEGPVSNATICKKAGGVWLDIHTKVDHGPCWNDDGAYLVNVGAGKVGDGIDHVPPTGNNPSTHNAQSEKFNMPDYVIIVSGKWQLCGTSSDHKMTCTSANDPFRDIFINNYEYANSAPYRPASGGSESNMKAANYGGGAYPLFKYDFYWSNSTGRFYTNFSTDSGIYLNRLK